MARNWGKKYEEVSKRISKKGKLAAEGHHLKQEADKKAASMTDTDYMERDGITNIETGEVMTKRSVDETWGDHKWMTMSESFYNKMLIPSLKESAAAELTTEIKTNIQKEVEVEMMEQLKAVLNEVLDTRESNKRQDEIRLAELRVKELELQVRLAELQVAAPVEFELAPFMPVNRLEGKLEEVVDEHSRAVDTIMGAVVVTEEAPAKLKKRVGRPKGSKNKKNKVEEVPVTVSPDLNAIRQKVAETPVIAVAAGTGKTGVTEDIEANLDTLIPAQYIRESGRINWKAIEADNMFLTVVASVIGDAVEKKVNVVNGNEFRKSGNLRGTVYQRFMDSNKGVRGAWKAFLMEIGVSI